MILRARRKKNFIPLLTILFLIFHSNYAFNYSVQERERVNAANKRPPTELYVTVVVATVT